MFTPVDPKQSFSKLEEEILSFWEQDKTFRKSIANRIDGDEYVFYDGPPFATGLPHYGHILAGTIKDVVPRYWTMKGKHITRRFGWDCHGLPIENEVEKMLKISGKQEIEEKIGIAKFNETCRSIVLKHTEDWKKVVARMGRWVDFDSPYKTMDKDYMESVWWVFKQLWDKGLVYEGYKPMHICPRCVTPLSNFEVGQGYKDVTDLSVFAKFKLKDENTYMLAWTTTPWTLPGNMFLAVHRDIPYVKVSFEGNTYIVAKDLVKNLFGEEAEMKDIDIMNYVGKQYEPLFPYYPKHTYKVLDADFVTAKDGTGIVHIAPAFGEDDMKVGQEQQVEFIQHVTMHGTFTDEVTDFAGESVKPIDDIMKMDRKIADYLEKKGLLFKKENYKHSYPHCWRCDSPLLNYATSSWFIKVTELSERMVKNNLSVHWVPEYIKEGRFGKWLENARDWAVSRNRFWGTPLPIWRCEETGETLCLGSVSELEEYIGKKVDDIHKHFVDDYVIKINKKKYRRVEEVFDCWFESGAMPYAQKHYPFHTPPKIKNKYVLVRHAQGQHNLTDTLESDPDRCIDGVALTDTGKTQAEKYAKKCSLKKIDALYSSDFLRAMQTAKAWEKKYKVKIEKDERLREMWFGFFDGKKIAEHRSDWPQYLRFEKSPHGGENYEDILNRMMDFIHEMEKKYSGKTIVIVSHGSPLRLLHGHLSGMLREEYVGTLDQPLGSFMIVDSSTQKHFEDSFPAQFIAEGQDQTRGWFYTLTVLSNALFKKPAFKNVIVNGIVLAEDGKKMSKRLKNYPDPKHIFDMYGADSMRLYLLNSPVVHGEDFRFSEAGIDQVLKNFMLPLWNSYSFFVTYANIDAFVPEESFDYSRLSHSLDRWILARLHETIRMVEDAMNLYHLQSATEPLYTLIDDLTNWYIRRSRRRFWKSEDDSDKKQAYQTLWYVLVELSKVLAPFAPFIADAIYQNLSSSGSVHLTDFPEYEKKYMELSDTKKIHILQNIVSLGHKLRAQEKVKVRQPLLSVKVSAGIEFSDEDISIIQEELNVKEVQIVDDPNTLAIKVVKPNARILGPRFGARVQDIIKAAKGGEYVDNGDGTFKVLGETLTSDEIEIGFESKDETSVAAMGNIVVSLNTTLTEDLILEGRARDFVRLVQDLRKEANFNVSDRISIAVSGEYEIFQNQFTEYIKNETLAIEITTSAVHPDIEKETKEGKISLLRVK